MDAHGGQPINVVHLVKSPGGDPASEPHRKHLGVQPASRVGTRFDEAAPHHGERSGGPIMSMQLGALIGQPRKHPEVMHVV